MKKSVTKRSVLAMLLMTAASVLFGGHVQPGFGQGIICCNIPVTVPGADYIGISRKVNCKEFLGQASPEVRNGICQQLSDLGPLCPEIAPICSDDKADAPVDKPCRVGGSIIEIENQVLGEMVAITGTPFSLHYRSDSGRARPAASTPESRLSGLGGWTLNVHHAYDPVREILYLGDGPQQPVGALFRQWATEAKASSERGSGDWSAKQATGKPDTFGPGESRRAWAPKGQDGTMEWLEIFYEKAVQPTTIDIREIFNPGFVTKVEAHNADKDAWVTLWQGKDPTTERPGVFSPPLSQTTFPTNRLRVTIDTNVPGWNEIDAVQLVAQPSLNWVSTGELAVPARDASDLYVFDRTGRHLRTLNTLTGALLYRFAYDAAGRLMAIEDNYGNITRIERNAKGAPTAIVAPYGQRTMLSTNANGYLASITNPAGEATHLSYSKDGLLAAFTDPKGYVSRFTYDDSRRLTKHEGPAGGVSALARTRTDNGFQATLSTALGRTSTYLVERLATGEERRENTGPTGAQIHVQTGPDRSTKITYPDGGMLTQVQQPDPRWGMQSSLFKALSLTTPGGLALSLSASRAVSLAEPDNPLSLTAQTDTASVNGRTYTRTVDVAQKRMTSITPTGRQAITTLDDYGRVSKVEVPGLLPLDFAYDERGRLTTITQGAGTEARVMSFSYNAEGRIASLTDSLKRTLRLEYDRAGRVTKQILPDGREISYTYDANGNPAAITPPGRPAHAFEYTPVNLTKEYFPPHVETDSKATSYAYNPEKQLTKITRPDGVTIDLIYDKAGHPDTVTFPGGQTRLALNPKTGQLKTIAAPDGSTLSYTYDGSLLTNTTWTGAIKGSVSRTFDNEFRITSRSVNGNQPIGYKYDADGLLIQAGALTLNRDAKNGIVTGTKLGSVIATQDYNGFGHQKRFAAAFNGKEIFIVQYERDVLGRITKKAETADGQTNTYTYDYDLAGRLTDVTKNGTKIAHYDYDSNSNRLAHKGQNGTLNGSYDAQDRLIQYGDTTYSHTANGEWSSKKVNAKVTTYEYDAFGNLRAATLPDGTKIEYVIDGRNRRIGKKVNSKLVQGFLYQDGLKPVAELDGQNNVVTRFIYATKINVPEYMEKGGKTYRILTDHLGSPRLVIDVATGEIAQRMNYDEFGNVLQDTKPGFQPFGFAGGVYDQQTKLTRFGARDYDAFTGRWTVKDPIRLSGGSNLYGYVGQNPVLYLDPAGLQHGEDGYMHDLVEGVEEAHHGSGMIEVGAIHAYAGDLLIMATAAEGGGAIVAGIGYGLGAVGVGLAGYGGYLMGQGINKIIGNEGQLGEWLADQVYPAPYIYDPLTDKPWVPPCPSPSWSPADRALYDKYFSYSGPAWRRGP